MHTLSGSVSNAKKYSATEYQTDNQYIYISLSFYIGIYVFSRIGYMNYLNFCKKSVYLDQYINGATRI